MIHVCFGTNEKWTSKLIRWATKSKWSHVWIEFHSESMGGVWAVHAQPEGIIVVPEMRARAGYSPRKSYIYPADIHEASNWLRSHVGSPYDYGVVWNALLLVLLRATKWKFLWKIVARNASKFSCSETACYLLKYLNAEGARNLDVELTTPGMLEEFCEDSEFFGKGWETFKVASK